MHWKMQPQADLLYEAIGAIGLPSMGHMESCIRRCQYPASCNKQMLIMSKVC